MTNRRATDNSSARVRQRRLLRTTGALETMAPSAGQSVALIDNLPNAADRIATILAEAQAALARLKGMNYETTRLIALSGK